MKNKPVDGTRLKMTRGQRKWSQDQLAEKSKLAKATIYRLERGAQKTLRQRSLDLLATVLSVEPGVLTGETEWPFASVEREEPDALLFEMHALNYRVDGAVRNSFTLAARRYGVPIARIIEVAPLLFVLAAEASFRRRSEQLAKLEELLGRQSESAAEFRHFPGHIFQNAYAQEASRAERSSIASRDLLADQVRQAVLAISTPDEDDEDAAASNPFVQNLAAEANRLNEVAVIERFDRNDVTFHVCRDEARALCGGDAILTDAVIRGCIALYKMPRELLAGSAEPQRLTWLREKYAEYQAVLTELMALGDNPSVQREGVI